MLNQAQKDFIAKAFGVSVEELTTGIASETEVNFTVPSGQFLTDEQKATLTDNLEKKGYDRGAIASREMALKDMSKAAGLDETIKDGNKLLETYKAKILEEAKVEPNDKIQTLESTIESLRGKIEEKDNEFVSLQKQVKQDKIKASVYQRLPELPETIGLTKEDAQSLFFNNYEIKDDGVYRNGELVVDDVHKPLGVEDVVKSWVSEKGWDKLAEAKPNGRGDGGGKPPGSKLPTTYEDYISELKSKGLSEASAEGQALLSEIAKEHPEVLD